MGHAKGRGAPGRAPPRPLGNLRDRDPACPVEPDPYPAHIKARPALVLMHHAELEDVAVEAHRASHVRHIVVDVLDASDHATEPPTGLKFRTACLPCRG